MYLSHSLSKMMQTFAFVYEKKKGFPEFISTVVVVSASILLICPVTNYTLSKPGIIWISLH